MPCEPEWNFAGYFKVEILTQHPPPVDLEGLQARNPLARAGCQGTVVLC